MASYFDIEGFRYNYLNIQIYSTIENQVNITSSILCSSSNVTNSLNNVIICINPSVNISTSTNVLGTSVYKTSCNTSIVVKTTIDSNMIRIINSTTPITILSDIISTSKLIYYESALMNMSAGLFTPPTYGHLNSVEYTILDELSYWFIENENIIKKNICTSNIISSASVQANVINVKRTSSINSVSASVQSVALNRKFNGVDISTIASIASNVIKLLNANANILSTTSLNFIPKTLYSAACNIYASTIQTFNSIVIKNANTNITCLNNNVINGNTTIIEASNITSTTDVNIVGINRKLSASDIFVNTNVNNNAIDTKYTSSYINSNANLFSNEIILKSTTISIATNNTNSFNAMLKNIGNVTMLSQGTMDNTVINKKLSSALIDSDTIVIIVSSGVTLRLASVNIDVNNTSSFTSQIINIGNSNIVTVADMSIKSVNQKLSNIDIYANTNASFNVIKVLNTGVDITCIGNVTTNDTIGVKYISSNIMASGILLTDVPKLIRNISANITCSNTNIVSGNIINIGASSITTTSTINVLAMGVSKLLGMSDILVETDVSSDVIKIINSTVSISSINILTVQSFTLIVIKNASSNIICSNNSIFNGNLADGNIVINGDSSMFASSSILVDSINKALLTSNISCNTSVFSNGSTGVQVHGASFITCNSSMQSLSENRTYKFTKKYDVDCIINNQYEANIIIEKEENITLEYEYVEKEIFNAYSDLSLKKYGDLNGLKYYEVYNKNVLFKITNYNLPIEVELTQIETITLEYDFVQKEILATFSDINSKKYSDINSLKYYEIINKSNSFSILNHNLPFSICVGKTDDINIVSDFDISSLPLQYRQLNDKLYDSLKVMSYSELLNQNKKVCILNNNMPLVVSMAKTDSISNLYLNSLETNVISAIYPIQNLKSEYEETIINNSFKYSELTNEKYSSLDQLKYMEILNKSKSPFILQNNFPLRTVI